MNVYNTKNRNILNEMKQKGTIDKINSKVILKKIFNYLQKRIFLQIIQTNKKLQNKLNLNIVDYKKLSELYSSIEIEIIPVKNTFHKLINIPSNKTKLYYHIYISNRKEETKINKINLKEKIKKIKVKIDYQITSFNGLFKNCSFIKYIYFKKFSRNNITDMSYMFAGCTSLKKLYFSNFNSENVQNMSYMFFKCKSLKEINLSNFNTNKVFNMDYMFSKCILLKELNVSNFNIDMILISQNMFENCTSLEKLSISKYDLNIVNSIINKDSLYYKILNYLNKNRKKFIYTALNKCGCISLKEIIIPDDNKKYIFNLFIFSPFKNIKYYSFIIICIILMIIIYFFRLQ